jgi:hypothetical protein
MERNANENLNDQSAGQGGSTGGFGAAGAGTAGTTGAGFGTEEAGRLGQARERAGEVAGNLRTRATEVAGTVRERAHGLKSTLADQLEAGAEKLRNRGQGAYAVADGGTAVAGGNTERLASGLQGTADWLREAHLEDLRTGVERQVRDHPGRTLLVALGLGYLLGKAFRK